MTSRRYATAPTKTPTLTGGDERPRPKCDGIFWPFDILASRTKGPDFSDAKAEILSDRLCGGCALRDAGCWAANRHEPWFYSLRGRAIPRHPKVAA